MKKNSIGFLSVMIVASLMTSVEAQVEWVRIDPSEAGINAARVLEDEGLYLCRGTYAEKPGGNYRWRDIGVVTKKGLCRTLRVKNNLKMQEDFYLLVADADVALRWQLQDNSIEVPEQAVRVRIDSGLPLCRGTDPMPRNSQESWRDIGVVTKKGLCRTLRVKKKWTMQEDFYVLIAEPKGDMDESAKLFTDIIGESATLAAALADWTEVWGGIAEEIEGNYGDFAEDFEFTEYTESELDLELPEREFAVDTETLSAIYQAAATVDWQFESIRAEIEFMSELLEHGAFAEEYADVNEQLITNLVELGGLLSEANGHWAEILNKLDYRIEGVASTIDQGGNLVASLGHTQRAAMHSLQTKNPANKGPSASISRSALETGGWSLSKARTGGAKARKGSKKKHNNQLPEEEFDATYFFVAWGGLFLNHEVGLLNDSLAAFAEIVTLANGE